jgi:hypothetical protein
MSEAVVKVAARLGVEDAYGSRQATWRETPLLELSPNRIRHACLTIGEQVEGREAEALTASQSLSAQLTPRQPVEAPQRI